MPIGLLPGGGLPFPALDAFRAIFRIRIRAEAYLALKDVPVREMPAVSDVYNAQAEQRAVDRVFVA
jgi:hypothetical protein